MAGLRLKPHRDDPEKQTMPDLWQFEREFWLGDAAVYEQRLSNPSLMVVPPPTGVLQRDACMAAVESVPRRTSIVLRQQTLVFPSADVATLACAARATRGNDPDYRARCSSTYVRDGAEWKLALHQQTPIAD